MLVGAALLQLALSLPAFAADVSPKANELFETRVRPLLVRHCYRCHSIAAKKSKGGLRLDTRAGLLKGGDSGPALIPGDPDKSLFIRAVRQTDEHLRMPPKQKLSSMQIADLAAWVKAGAPDPVRPTPQRSVRPRNTA